MPDSLGDIEGMARDTLAGLPTPFQPGIASIVLQVVDWPEAGMLAELGIDDPRDLTGLYNGTPLTLKSASDPAPYPDMIWLFRQPILDEWRTRATVDLRDLIAHVTIHEVAHHFGWSDDDIAAIDRWWE